VDPRLLRAALVAVLPLCGVLPAQGRPASEFCCDEVDNDGDSKVDLEDTDCIDSASCYSKTESWNCCNARDDDADGKIDLQDPDCSASPD